jgi:hypothetical protein
MDDDGLGALLGGYGSEEEDDSHDNLAHLTGPEAGLPRHDSPAASPRGAEKAAQAAPPPEGDAHPSGGGGAGAGAATPPAAAGSPPHPSGAADADAYDNGLPPELARPPPGECDPAVQARVARWLELQARGRQLTDELRASRDYRNPQFFRKMVEYWEIDERGTAFAPEVFDPSSLPAEDRVGALRAEWAAEEERRRAVKAAGGGRIEFTKASQQQQQQQQAAAGGGGLNPLLPQLGGAQLAAVSSAVAAAQAKAAAFAAAAGYPPRR